MPSRSISPAAGTTAVKTITSDPSSSITLIAHTAITDKQDVKPACNPKLGLTQCGGAFGGLALVG
jgi:hypothetical protein